MSSLSAQQATGSASVQKAALERERRVLAVRVVNQLRLATLRDAGLDPEVVVSGVDESQVVTDDPAHLATALAELKADTVAARLAAEGPRSGRTC